MKGKVLIVTASTGIAAAFARQAAAAGAHLVIATGDAQSGWELAKHTAEVWAEELSGADSAESGLPHCLSKFGRVDGLFNAAGLSGRRFGDGPAHECAGEGWDTTLAQNLGIVFRTCRAATGRILQQEPGANGIRGAILNMGSVLSEAPQPRHFATHACAAAKGAAAAMTRCMAACYAPHKIRVNASAPGLVRTPMSEGAQGSPELLEFIGKKQPLTGGTVDAADVARAALFPLGAEARSITGGMDCRRGLERHRGLKSEESHGALRNRYRRRADPGRDGGRTGRHPRLPHR